MDFFVKNCQVLPWSNNLENSVFQASTLATLRLPPSLQT